MIVIIMLLAGFCFLGAWGVLLLRRYMDQRPINWSEPADAFAAFGAGILTITGLWLLAMPFIFDGMP